MEGLTDRLAEGWRIEVLSEGRERHYRVTSPEGKVKTFTNTQDYLRWCHGLDD